MRGSTMVLNDHRVQVFYDVLTGLSRCHSLGALYVPESVLAKETGMNEHDVHVTMRDAEGLGWVTTDRYEGNWWRLVDGVVAVVLRLTNCEVCNYVYSGRQVRAIAEARASSGRWVNVCPEHFVAGDCNLGRGLGQMLRLEY